MNIKVCQVEIGGILQWINQWGCQHISPMHGEKKHKLFKRLKELFYYKLAKKKTNVFQNWEGNDQKQALTQVIC